MLRTTLQRIATPTALLVALSDELATACITLLGDAGLRVLRVGHVAAASERIPVVMPQLVVVSSDIGPAELETLRDRCVAVGAAVLEVGSEPLESLTPRLKSAALIAVAKAHGAV